MNKINELAEYIARRFGYKSWKTINIMGIRPDSTDNFYLALYSELESIEVEVCSIGFISNLDPDSRFVESYTHEDYDEITTDLGCYRVYRRG